MPPPSSPASGHRLPPVEQLVQWYEQLTPEHLSRLDVFYAPDARFKDPFNDVRGIAAITQVFRHMFATLEQPRFEVSQQFLQGEEAVLVWNFHYRMKRWRPSEDRCIHGVTLLHFDPHGRVDLHRDYWDAAEELYEQLPVLGILMRWLRKAASASARPDRERHRPH